VGCGKTMLMDLFLARVEAAAPGLRTRRVHFHEFMLDTHKQLHAQKQLGAEDPLPAVAGALAGGWGAPHASGAQALLCFDEFQVRQRKSSRVGPNCGPTLWL
jgi:predicted ATPase